MQWFFPVSYPVTVAGAAPVSHRLPFWTHAASPMAERRGRHRTVWSVKEVPHGGGHGNDYFWFGFWGGLTGAAGGIVLFVIGSVAVAPMPPP